MGLNAGGSEELRGVGMGPMCGELDATHIILIYGADNEKTRFLEQDGPIDGNKEME